jgi:hypothetical protein
MLTADECRDRAKDCIARLQDAQTPQEKQRWQELASAWIQLADGGLLMPPDFPNPPAPS